VKYFGKRGYTFTHASYQSMTISRKVSEIKTKQKRRRKISSGNCLRSHIINKNYFIII
jgi:predicted nucleotidyltransferase